MAYCIQKQRQLELFEAPKPRSKSADSTRTSIRRVSAPKHRPITAQFLRNRAAWQPLSLTEEIELARLEQEEREAREKRNA